MGSLPLAVLPTARMVPLGSNSSATEHRALLTARSRRLSGSAVHWVRSNDGSPHVWAEMARTDEGICTLLSVGRDAEGSDDAQDGDR